jgi:two-component system sensor histidine kinase RstB
MTARVFRKKIVPVFDPFIRLDESRGRKTGGHGLGLAIVAGIARLHHGEVKVEASPLGGARFIIRWPT